MKKFLIEEGEKQRILNMHKNAIKKQYLSEQSQVVDKTIIDKIIEKYITADFINSEGLEGRCKADEKNDTRCLNFVKGQYPDGLDNFFTKYGFKKYTDQWSDEDYINANNIYNNLEKNNLWDNYQYRKNNIEDQNQVVDKQNPLYKMVEKLVDEYYPNLDDLTTEYIIKNLNDRTINYDENSTFYTELNPNLVPFMKQIIQDKSNGKINFGLK